MGRQWRSQCTVDQLTVAAVACWRVSRLAGHGSSCREWRWWRRPVTWPACTAPCVHRVDAVVESRPPVASTPAPSLHNTKDLRREVHDKHVTQETGMTQHLSPLRVICSQPVYTRATPFYETCVGCQCRDVLCITVSADVWRKVRLSPSLPCGTVQRLHRWTIAFNKPWRFCHTENENPHCWQCVHGRCAWNALPHELRTISSKTIFHNRLNKSFST